MLSLLLPFLVILDPGHGGDDTGALRHFHGKLMTEKNITLSIALKTAEVLRAQGIPVVLTRNFDETLSLDQRTANANEAAKKASNSIFVSIHANAVKDKYSSGIETYVFKATTNEASKRLANLENGKRWAKSHSNIDLIMADLATTANYSESLKLARSVQSSILRGLKNEGQSIRNRHVRRALFYVLMQTRMPSILFEPGFISNDEDLIRLTDPQQQTVLAQQLARGITQYRNQTQDTSTKLSGISKQKAHRPSVR